MKLYITELYSLHILKKFVTLLEYRLSVTSNTTQKKFTVYIYVFQIEGLSTVYKALKHQVY
jgi:hypothetical protein